ncbi:MAG: nucleotide pyrophosphohydrolase [Deltaproteobacteria bacterium]|nr:nucleotide pyrophosphohydrolase [Deltaproteobacteria bacterium]
MHDADTPLAVLSSRLAEFNAARDWGRFHNPKDLATALAIEASELLELFLWKPASHEPADWPARARLEAECADVLICLVNLARTLGVDLMAAAEDKLAHNADKYPVERARGSAKKYDELP